MKDHKKILKEVALNPFHPLYNLGEKTYSLTTSGSFNSVRVGKVVEKELTTIPFPTYIDISSEDFELFTTDTTSTILNNKELFDKVVPKESLLVSYLLSVLLGKEGECWWIDSLLYELEESIDLNLLLNIQRDYRDILLSVKPSLKVYIPYHWVELALLSATVDGQQLSFANHLTLDSSISREYEQVLNSEYEDFLISIKGKRLSQVHIEYIMKHLILCYIGGDLKFGQPFPFDTKGKKVEKVSIKVINIPSGEK